MNIHPNKQFFQVAGARDQTTDPWITRAVLYPYTMAIGVVEFSREGYKIRKVFA